MKYKKPIILILLTLYVFAIVALTIYHAFNFSNYIHRKGDETANYIFFLLLTSLLLQGLIWITTKTFDWKAVVLSTVVNFFVSFIVGLIILRISGLTGIPKHLIFLYGGCYLTFFVLVTITQANRLNAKTQAQQE